MIIRTITPGDDRALAEIIRTSLRAHRLDIPGTAYFDPELDHLSRFYGAKPGRRYFVAADEAGQAMGGAGAAEYPGRAGCAELQKLYLADGAKGQGLGARLIDQVCAFARQAGYREICLETHHELVSAVSLYRRKGFVQLPLCPVQTEHGAMDLFFLKTLE